MARLTMAGTVNETLQVAVSLALMCYFQPVGLVHSDSGLGSHVRR